MNLKLLKSGALIAVLSCASLGQQLIAATNVISSGQQANPLGMLEESSQLLGQPFKSSEGASLGKLQDMVVDLESGHILYAVLSANGKNYAFPPNLLRPAADKKSLVAHAPKAKITAAPVFSESDANLANPSFAASVFQYYGLQAWWDNGSGAASGKNFGNVHRLSQLNGATVQSSANQNLGRIDNSILDLRSGHVAFLILNASSLLGNANALLAVPPNAFTAGQNAKVLVTGLDKNTLASAPRWTRNNLNELSNPAKAASIYSFYGKQPYFQSGTGLSPTGRNP